ncbi:hypothetical protein AMI01nite_59350 [Aneurinibacillus migulanus]|nr:hypothetical protein AMI01nite_59350 [Aneurinibacillus migulanus]
MRHPLFRPLFKFFEYEITQSIPFDFYHNDSHVINPMFSTDIYIKTMGLNCDV